MKNIWKKVLLETLICFALIIVLAFIFSSLEKSGILAHDLGELILEITGIVIFFFYAFLLGRTFKKRGLILGLVFVGIYLGISIPLLSSNHLFTTIKSIMLALKALALLCGAIIGVNSSSESKIKSRA